MIWDHLGNVVAIKTPFEAILLGLKFCFFFVKFSLAELGLNVPEHVIEGVFRRIFGKRVEVAFTGRNTNMACSIMNELLDELPVRTSIELDL